MSDRNARLRDALNALCWSGSALGHATGNRASTGRRWANGTRDAPDAVLIWIEDLARYHDAHPPPEPPAPESLDT
jgi:hypothetical protein